ncbi:3-keto-disaccharide hydrolase [Limnovirga soli]|uniref:DUF1080 domain-containing protein n=1 Tax=Limnovirga soli TaxID=2656915 RepID=A0A8J8FEN8_9BACT|nr:DUF1080 domain-containing protein [Limnovirga soli]NNV55207.1 DUF1080 domain-containing protein [Limnovirga soli]
MKWKMFSKKTMALFVVLCTALQVFSQQKIDLSTSADFNNASANWHIAGDVKADLNTQNVLLFTAGKGVLVNIPVADARGDLFTNFSHGDMDIELDYMMALSSNSGIYLQGRYEVQLLDSWKVVNPRSGDNGGIYERWDEQRPEGAKGYDGHAPRQNVSKAPGLWQHLKIAFRAPRFAGGKKIENARFLRVELNGVLIQENVSLSGVTRGAISEEEVPEAPLRFQGDHGAVAFRNIVVTNYNNPSPALTNIEYSVYAGAFKQQPDFKTLKPVINKNAQQVLSANIPNLPGNMFMIHYNSKLLITTPGNYNFKLNSFGGGGILKLNGNTIIPYTEWNSKGTANLPAGTVDVDLVYCKNVDWAKPYLAMELSGPGIRPFILSDATAISNDDVDPILINATENIIHRSFIDLPGSFRVTHSISVGSPSNVHYTYDMDNGMIVQVWRGGFLDATPMWHERGDGSSKPVGAVQYFGKPALMVQQLSSANNSWPADTLGSSFIPKGYITNEKNLPVFKYRSFGASINDGITVLEGNEGLHRVLSIENAAPNLYVRLAEADNIEDAGNGLFLINDKAYYLRIADIKPLIRDINGHKEMLVPFSNTISYDILF